MAQNLAPNFSFKHGRQQSTKSSYRPVGLGSSYKRLSCDQQLGSSLKNQGRRGRKNKMNMLHRMNTPRSASKKRSRLWKHHYPGGFFHAFPKANSRVYSLPNRSAGFSNSPRQPEANVRLCRGTEARSPRWLSEPGQFQWMSAITGTGTMIPIGLRCRESVCLETS